METYFLQNTGRVLLASILQFSILYLLYVSLKNTILKKISARADYLTLLLLVFTGAVLFVSGIVNSFSQSGNASFFASNGLLGNRYAFLNPVLQWTAIVYFVVTIVRAVFLLLQLGFPQHRKNLSPVPLTPDFTEYLSAFCAHVRLKMPRIMFSTKAATPFVTGLFRSMIVIPASFQGCFTPQEMEAVILHELAHLKRLDVWMNIPIIICGQLLFFNPFAILLIRRLRSQREMACDDWVLAHQVKPMHYATALYKSARKQSHAWQLAMSAGHGELYTRIQRLFAKNRSHHPYKLRIAPFATLLLCLPLMMQVAPVISNKATTPVFFAANEAPVQLTEHPLPVIENTITKPVIELVNIPAEKKKQPAKIVIRQAAKDGSTVNDYVVEFQQVSDAISIVPKAVFVANDIKRSGDIILKFSDSVNLYAGFISKANVENITNSQLEKVMGWVMQGVMVNDSNARYSLFSKSPEIKVDVTHDGEKNLYFANATVSQQTYFDAYFQQWKIRFSIMNGDQQIGDRYVTIYQRRKLQSARL